LRIIGRGVSVFVLWVTMLVLADPVAAQSSGAGGVDVLATRAELQEQLARLEGAAISQAYSASLREEARQRALQLRRRLSQGDFRPGDPVLLAVEGQTTLTDTFVVSPQGAVTLPTIGRVPMEGVLRSELESHLTEQVSRFIRDPILTASSFMRITVTGDVSRPGFHVVAPTAPISDVLMNVAGLGQNAKVSAIHVQRANETILAGERMNAALSEGATLTRLGLRSGDEIVVPSTPQFTPLQIAQNIGLLSGFLFTLDRIFRN